MQADFKGGGRGDAGLVFYSKVQVKREPGVEVVFGTEPDRMHGLDDIRDLILYVESIIESFSADLKPA